MYDECAALYKIIVVGDSGVGKTNLLTRFTRNEFNIQSKPTIGVDFFWKAVEVDSITVKAQIWDTAGQERYKAFSATYFIGAHAALITYDITERRSFENIQKWVHEIGQYMDLRTTPIMLVGNKKDLDELRQVSLQEGKDFAKKHDFFFIETSAMLDLTGEVAQASIDNEFPIVVIRAFNTVIECKQQFDADLYKSQKKGSADETAMNIPMPLDKRRLGGSDAQPKKKFCCLNV